MVKNSNIVYIDEKEAFFLVHLDEKETNELMASLKKLGIEAETKTVYCG
jgi:type III secretory pathway lipoprotein EscJ